MNGMRAGIVLRNLEIDACRMAYICKSSTARAVLTSFRDEVDLPFSVGVECQVFKEGPSSFRYLLGNFEFTRMQFWAILQLLPETK
jgi:hypothetical protein